MSKFGGVFYSKGYQEFRAVCQSHLAALGTEPTTEPLSVELEFVVTKPRTSKMPYPRGDLDNLVKGPMDSATDAGTLWLDDNQVLLLRASKRWASHAEPEGIHFAWSATT